MLQSSQVLQHTSVKNSTFNLHSGTCIISCSILSHDLIGVDFHEPLSTQWTQQICSYSCHDRNGSKKSDSDSEEEEASISSIPEIKFAYQMETCRNITPLEAPGRSPSTWGSSICRNRSYEVQGFWVIWYWSEWGHLVGPCCSRSVHRFVSKSTEQFWRHRNPVVSRIAGGDQGQSTVTRLSSFTFLQCQLSVTELSVTVLLALSEPPEVLTDVMVFQLTSSTKSWISSTITGSFMDFMLSKKYPQVTERSPLILQRPGPWSLRISTNILNLKSMWLSRVPGRSNIKFQGGQV